MEEKLFLELMQEELPDSILSLDTIFRKLDDWDSLTGMSIIVILEEKCRIKISNDNFKEFKTFNDILNFINLNS